MITSPGDCHGSNLCGSKMGFYNLERNLLNLRGTTFLIPSPPSYPLGRPPHRPMLSVVLLFFSITFASNLTLACEGECIVNVTRFILRSYSIPVYNVFRDVVSHRPYSLSLYPIFSNSLEKSKTPSSHPLPALLIRWTTLPLSFRHTRGMATLAWNPQSSLPTSTENVKTRLQVSFQPAVRTPLALSFVGHRVLWSTTSRSSGESRSILYTQSF